MFDFRFLCIGSFSDPGWILSFANFKICGELPKYNSSFFDDFYIFKFFCSVKLIYGHNEGQKSRDTVPLRKRISSKQTFRFTSRIIAIEEE
jgi:hypothetical protein